MRSIEKSLANFVQGKGPRVSNETICDYAVKDADGLVDILFNIISSELDNVTGLESLERVRALFECVSTIINYTEIDRKKTARRIRKLHEKIDRVKLENKKKFQNVTNAYRELEKVRDRLDDIDEEVLNTETSKYAFIKYLIEEEDVTYIEYAFNKMPNLVNVKDRDEATLFRNIVKKYIKSIKEEDLEKELYFSNLISLVLAQEQLKINVKEKKTILNLIYTSIDQLRINKKTSKHNKDKIDNLIDLAEVIKEEDTKDAKIDLLANKYNIAIHFPEDILEKIDLIKDLKVNPTMDREIVDEYIITIDGAGAVEIDDALSCKKLSNGNYLLGVHIASVLGYFPYKSEVIDEAFKRTKSIYLPRRYKTKDNSFNKTIPIFPSEFSSLQASLKSDSFKYARSYFFEIDNTGDIVSEKFKKTIIKSDKNTTYKEIDKILEYGSDDKELEKLSFNLREVAELLGNRYHGEDIYEKLKESVIDPSDLRVKRAGAEKIVYQSMLLTGNRVAEFFAQNGYPCLYRVHEVNFEDSKKLQALIDNLTKTYGGEEYIKLYQLIDGIYPRGWYDSVGRHDGLGLDHYCHCTSCLRRAADILVEHGLEVCYDKNPTDKRLAKLEEEIEKRKLEINNKKDTIDWFVKDYNRTYQKRRR